MPHYLQADARARRRDDHLGGRPLLSRVLVVAAVAILLWLSLHLLSWTTTSPEKPSVLYADKYVPQCTCPCNVLSHVLSDTRRTSNIDQLQARSSPRRLRVEGPDYGARSRPEYAQSRSLLWDMEGSWVGFYRDAITICAFSPLFSFCIF